MGEVRADLSRKVAGVAASGQEQGLILKENLRVMSQIGGVCLLQKRRLSQRVIARLGRVTGPEFDQTRSRRQQSLLKQATGLPSWSIASSQQNHVRNTEKCSKHAITAHKQLLQSSEN
jgi:hypothetical protein